MDWDHAIKRNSEVLAGIVADLFVMLGLVTLTDTVSRLPWPTYRAVLRILRPAESALRRLIVVAARGLVVKPMVSRPRKAGAAKPRKKGTARFPPSSFSTRSHASCCRAAEHPSGLSPASTFSIPMANL